MNPKITAFATMTRLLGVNDLDLEFERINAGLYIDPHWSHLVSWAGGRDALVELFAFMAASEMAIAEGGDDAFEQLRSVWADVVEDAPTLAGMWPMWWGEARS